MRVVAGCLIGTSFAFSAASAAGQSRPDFSGVWRLEAAASRMIGSDTSGGEHRLTWLVNHRDPEISVVVNLRDEHGSHEYAFRCTTDGRECVNELPELGEVRRISAVWEDSVLVMSQRATTPHGDFTARDRLSLSGEQLIFERTITNERGDRVVRQVFRKLGPHPSQRAPAPLPSVKLPPALDRLLRDYEKYWRPGHADSLTALFEDDEC